MSRTAERIAGAGALLGLVGGVVALLVSTGRVEEGGAEEEEEV